MIIAILPMPLLIGLLRMRHALLLDSLTSSFCFQPLCITHSYLNCIFFFCFIDQGAVLPMSSEVVLTACTDWSLNVDPSSSRRFWWNNVYSITVWEDTLNIEAQTSTITDADVWSKYIETQIGCIFKVCSICKEPEGNEDLKICCYCSNPVHERCSEPASHLQIMWKPSNLPFSAHMRACFDCQAVDYETKDAPTEELHQDDVRRAAKRALALSDEYPNHITDAITKIFERSEREHDEAALMKELQLVVVSFFQSPASLSFLRKERIVSKGGGIGVVAAEAIPAYSIIGVYPGYLDWAAGEQAKLGRPVSKYALMSYNCANYFNNVFVELQETFTPFINEPNEGEKSNCAWIQEPHRKNGRLSVMSIRDIAKGEELTIGYGPLYPRTYPFCYDAYAFHPVEGYTPVPCFALWHWATFEEADAHFVGNIGYLAEEDRYVVWEAKA